MAPKLKVDVFNPKEFNGMKFAKDVDNFLWVMGQYFRAKGILNNDIEVNTAAMYFIDVVML